MQSNGKPLQWREITNELAKEQDQIRIVELRKELIAALEADEARMREDNLKSW